MTTANWQRGSRSSNKLYISGIRSGKGNKTKGGDRKRFNDWIRKVMARQTREHKHEKRIVRTLIFPTVLYGWETWTMTKKMEKRSMHVICGYGGRCKEYHGRRKRPMKVYAWRLE